MYGSVSGQLREWRGSLSGRTVFHGFCGIFRFGKFLCSEFFYSVLAAEQFPVSQASGELTGEDALDLAIAHAKVDPSAVKKTKIEQDMKRGVPVYEIDFDMDYGEYDYKITVADGTVLDVDYEAYDYAVRQSPSNPVTMEDAKGLAASKVPGASAGDIRIWEERDDGFLTFEGEFYFDNAKHEFEIDSSTGKILKWDADFPH